MSPTRRVPRLLAPKSRPIRSGLSDARGSRAIRRVYATLDWPGSPLRAGCSFVSLGAHDLHRECNHTVTPTAQPS
jgi:hypothetical protein